MAAATNLFTIEAHKGGFSEDECCLVCQQADTSEPVAAVGAIGFLGNRRIEVLSSGPTTRPISDRELVHLTCHPNQPYHHKCIKDWLDRNASCPLDRRAADIRSPSVQSPGVHNLSATDLRVQSVAMQFFRSR